MRKVVLRMNEDFKYSLIKKLVDFNGNKKRAALQLNCSIRTVNRLIVYYRAKYHDSIFTYLSEILKKHEDLNIKVFLLKVPVLH